MIGAPSLDPRRGDRRKKALMSALQRSAQQRSGMSRFSRTGVGRGSVAGYGRRPVAMGGRPTGILSFLSSKAPQGFARGLSSFHGRSGGLGQLVAATQLPSAPLPSPDLGTSPAGTPYSAPGTGGLQPPVDEGSVVSENTSFEEETGVSSPFDIPSSPYGGLIPLGGGLFINPVTGNLTTGLGGIEIYPDNPGTRGTGIQE